MQPRTYDGRRVVMDEAAMLKWFEELLELLNAADISAARESVEGAVLKRACEKD